MRDSVIIRRCATLSEAQICTGLLHSRDIWATIDNAEHAAVDWGSIQALGGVHVRVLASEFDAAKQAITDAVLLARKTPIELDEEFEPILRNRRWRGLSMLVIWFGLFNFIAGIVLVWLDQVIPPDWIPEPQYTEFWAGYYVGSSAAAPWPGLSGLVYIFLIALFLILELLLTQPEKSRQEPQV